MVCYLLALFDGRFHFAVFGVGGSFTNKGRESTFEETSSNEQKFLLCSLSIMWWIGVCIWYLLSFYNFLFLLYLILLFYFLYFFVCFLYLPNSLHIIVKSKDFASLILHVYFLVIHLRLYGIYKHRRLYFCFLIPFYLCNEFLKMSCDFFFLTWCSRSN